MGQGLRKMGKIAIFLFFFLFKLTARSLHMTVVMQATTPARKWHLLGNTRESEKGASCSVRTLVPVVETADRGNGTINPRDENWTLRLRLGSPVAIRALFAKGLRDLESRGHSS
jgi:hypothetical protein